MAFPKVRVTGGPHGKNLEVTIDGEKVAKAHRAEIILDVNDVVRLKLWQFVEADVDLDEAAIERKINLRVMAPAVEEVDGEQVWTRELIGQFEGDTMERVLEQAIEYLSDFVPLVPSKPAPTLTVVHDA